MSRRHKRKLRNYLIDHSYQVRHTMALLLVCLVILGIMGSYWYREMVVANEVIEVGVIATMRQGDAVRVHQQMAAQRQVRMAVMVGGAGLLCLVVVGFMVVLTHRVAGPLYAIRRQMKQIRDGGLADLRPLRKGDAMADMYKTFHAMASTLQGAAEKDLEQIDAAVARAEEGEDEGLKEILGELRQRKVALLGKTDADADS